MSVPKPELFRIALTESTEGDADNQIYLDFLRSLDKSKILPSIVSTSRLMNGTIGFDVVVKNLLFYGYVLGKMHAEIEQLDRMAEGQ